MKISTRSRYGLRAMLELALRYGEGLVMMQSIATNQGVSRKYLDTIFSSLKAGGLVRSRRGIGGGHVLARAPADIRVSDVLRAIEGPVSLVDCVHDAQLCARSHRCVTRDIWSEVGQAIERVLESMTLADLVQKHLQKSEGAAAAEHEQDCPLLAGEAASSEEASSEPASTEEGTSGEDVPSA